MAINGLGLNRLRLPPVWTGGLDCIGGMGLGGVNHLSINLVMGFNESAAFH